MKFLDGVQSVGGFVGRWFAVLVIAAAVLGMIIPGQAAPLAVHIPVLLQVIMFGMGLTLRGVDCGACRGPFRPLTEEGKARVKAVLEQHLGEAL